MGRLLGVRGSNRFCIYTRNLKYYNVVVNQTEQREQFVLNGMNSGGKKLRAWNELTLEEQRTHRQQVRRFRTMLYQEHVFEGLGVRELAEKYKISRTYVITHIQRHTSMLAKKKELDIPAERMDQYQKLKMLMDATYDRALKGDDFAIKSYVSLSARFAKVIGLDAPTRFHHQVDKKTTHVVEHTVDIEDLERRIALVKERKALLAANKALAAPISEHDSDREDPVFKESCREDQMEVALSPISGTEDSIDASFSVVVPEQFVAEVGTIDPVPVATPNGIDPTQPEYSAKLPKYGKSELVTPGIRKESVL